MITIAGTTQDWDTLYPLICSVCASVGPGDEDLVQEVAIRLLKRNARTHDPIRSIKAYIRQAAASVMADRYRRTATRLQSEAMHSQLNA